MISDPMIIKYEVNINYKHWIMITEKRRNISFQATKKTI